MLPSSHLVPILGSTENATEGAIPSFEDFIRAATKLEDVHYELHREVSRLRNELEVRNAALESSIAEANSVRTALKAILEALPCGVIVIDEDGETVNWTNPEASRLLGTKEPVLSIRQLPISLITITRNGDTSIAEDEICIESSGARRWLAVRRSDLRMAPNRSNRILILRDITHEKTKEANRERSRNLVALGEVASILAHEIRNPLASMELFAELITGAASATSKEKHWASNIQAGIRQLSATVNNVLTFYSDASPALETVDLSQLAHSVASFISPQAQQKSLRIRVQASEGVLIKGSGAALQQVLLNLAGNSIRHTEPGGELLFQASQTDRRVRLSLTDTGSGILAEMMSSVFDSGFSGGHRPGLGLAVCKRVVEQHSGSICLQSQWGKGTTVVMEFPAI